MEEGQFPLGVIFNPLDEEILHYLKGIMENRSKPLPAFITPLDIYSVEPWELPQYLFRYGPLRDEAFFFTLRHAVGTKGKGIRARRSSCCGVWLGKSTKKKIVSHSQTIGHKTPFTFKISDGSKARWTMNEYQLHSDQFQEYGICRIQSKNKAAGWSVVFDEGEEMEEGPSKKKARILSGELLVNRLGSIPDSCSIEHEFSNMAAAAVAAAEEEQRLFSLPRMTHLSSMEQSGFPLGVIFCPFDVEIIKYLKRIMADRNKSLPSFIQEQDVYSVEPSKLCRDLFIHGRRRNKAFFFTPRHRAGDKGTRAKCTVGRGVWLGKESAKNIISESRVVGHKTTRTFVIGNRKKDEVVWIMQEFWLHSDQFQEAAICSIYQKSNGNNAAAAEFAVEESECGNTKAQIATICATEERIETAEGGSLLPLRSQLLDYSSMEPEVESMREFFSADEHQTQEQPTTCEVLPMGDFTDCYNSVEPIKLLSDFDSSLLPEQQQSDSESILPWWLSLVEQPLPFEDPLLPEQQFPLEDTGCFLLCKNGQM